MTLTKVNGHFDKFGDVLHGVPATCWAKILKDDYSTLDTCTQASFNEALKKLFEKEIGPSHGDNLCYFQEHRYKKPKHEHP